MHPDDISSNATVPSMDVPRRRQRDEGATLPEIASMGDERTSVARRLSRARPAAALETRRMVKYGIVGVLNVAIDFSLYALLVTIGVWYPLAKTMSLTVATANGYTLNRIWTFRAGPHRHIALAKYAGVQAVSLAANVTVLALLVEIAGLNEIVAQAIALPFIAVLSFLGQRLWTFREALA
jgi:putative flippase GtrA